MREALTHVLGIIKTFEKYFPGFEKRVLETLLKNK